jgi:hypothetical protein
MTLVAHAIARGSGQPIDAVGLRGRPLVWTDVDGIGLWSTNWNASESFGRDDLMRHHAVVEHIHAVQAALPVRFGTTFADPAAARASLAAKRAALLNALDVVDGKSELALTLLWKDRPNQPRVANGAAAGGGPGTRYLVSRSTAYRAREADRKRAAELVERVIAELSVDRALVWHALCTAETVAASLAVLVPTGRALARRDELTRIAAALPDVTAVVSGPWPPYSFAVLDDDRR